jgi:hypothetical protein
MNDDERLELELTDASATATFAGNERDMKENERLEQK